MIDELRKQRREELYGSRSRSNCFSFRRRSSLWSSADLFRSRHRFCNFPSRAENNAQAFAIAEAGIEYYRWHLAHAPAGFQDGTGHAGPYVHNYYDKDGNQIGQFTLDDHAAAAGLDGRDDHERRHGRLPTRA